MANVTKLSDDAIALLVYLIFGKLWIEYPLLTERAGVMPKRD